MASIALVFFLGFIYWDFKFLQKIDAELFEKHFFFSGKFQWLFGLLALLGGVVAVLPAMDFRTFFTGCFIFLLPVYLIRRFQLIRALEKIRQSVYSNKDRWNLVVAVDWFTVIIYWFIGSTVMTLAIRRWLGLWPEFYSELVELLFITVFTSFYMVFLIYLTAQKYPGKDFLEMVGMHFKKTAVFKTILMPVLVGIVWSVIASYVLTTRQLQPSTPMGELVDTAESGAVLVVFLGIALLVAPLLEEIIFRGYFFFVLRHFCGNWPTIVIISILFAVLHFDQYWGDWMAILMVTLLGFSLTYLRVWANSTLATVITHYVYNSGVTIIPVIMLMSSNPAYFEYQKKFMQLSSPQKEELLKESVVANPKFSDAYNDLAWMYAQESRNLEEALELIDQALSLEPKRSAFLDTKAEVLFKMGRIPEAVAIERQLLERSPDNSYFMGQIEKFEKALPGI